MSRPSPESAAPRCVLVVGMHRSGTSAVARVLNLLGLELGNSLMPPQTGVNDRGFWEPLRLVRLHDELLEMLGSRWDDPRPLPEQWWNLADLAPIRAKLISWLRQTFGECQLFAIKDPRLCRLLPLWRRLLSELNWGVACVLVTRNPIEVAQSLQQREELEPAASHALWMDHMLRAERDSRDLPRSLVTFGQLLTDWKTTVGRIEEQTGVLWPRSPQVAAPAIGQFLSGALRHHVVADEAVLRDRRPTQWIAATYEELLAASETGEHPEFRDRLDRLRRDLAQAQHLLGPWVNGGKIKSLEDEVARARAEAQRATGLQQERSVITERLEGEVARARAEAERAAGFQRELSAITESTTWKLTRPFRELRHLQPFRAGPGVAERCRAAARLARSTYYVYRREGVAGVRARGRAKLAALRAGARGLESTPRALSLRSGDWPRLEFPGITEPVASVIIPAHNHFAYTYLCLEKLLSATEGVSFETIVVDDGSSDETSQLESYVEGVRVLRNASNLGFVDSCNRAARTTRGRYIVFLNNDTAARPGWLSTLLETFDSFPEAGLVGPKLVYPDGRLQEAGGIVWSDGTAWNYGRGDVSNRPEYSFLRDTDYCSAACIAVPRQLFFEVAGFDPQYGPAYYEDVDLAFKIRATGRRVLYQPASEIVHFEGVTAGTTVDSGVKHQQLLNRKKFAEKWADQLTQHWRPPPASDARFAPSREAKHRMLILDARVPMPDHDAGSLRMYRLLEILLSLNCHVTFLSIDRPAPSRYSRALERMGVETFVEPHVRTVKDHLQERSSYYDVVLLSRLDVAKKYMDATRRLCRSSRTIFDTVDLHFLRESRQVDLEGPRGRAHIAKLRRKEELSVARAADVTFVVSETEREILLREIPDLFVQVVSTIHQIHERRSPFENRWGVLFIGSFEHPPNLDAIQYYISEIHPRVRLRQPTISLTVIGSEAPYWLYGLADDGISVEGQVPDVGPYFESCRLSVAPLRFGAGVKGKISSSLSYGVPVVSTSLGVEGMHLVDGESVLVEDHPEAFAEAVVRLHSDSALWKKLSLAGQANLEEHFSYDVARAQLADVLQRL